MHCPESHQWMSLKLDGCLSAAQEQRLEDHLGACPACSDAWRRWQAIDELFAGVPMAEPAAELSARVMARIQRRPRPRAVGGSLLVMGLGLVVVAAVLLPPAAYSLCAAALTVAESPDVWSMVTSAATQLLQIATTALQAGRLLVWGALNSPSIVVAVAYPGVALAVVAVWLRLVVFRKAPLPAASRLPV